MKKILLVGLVASVIGIMITVGSLAVLNAPKKSPATIRIGAERASCSAFVITDDYALSALHCMTHPLVLMTRQIPVYKPNSNEIAQIARVKFPIIKDIDMALIKGDFSHYDKFNYNDQVINLDEKNIYSSCGFPFGSKNLVCNPISPYENYHEVYKAKGFIIFGMSGGPVINLTKNLVVGVNVGLADGFVAFAPIISLNALFGLE